MSATTGVLRNIIVRVPQSQSQSPSESLAARFKGLITNNKITLTNLFLSAVIACLELLLSAEVFDCPLENHGAYGRMFLLAPVIIVFIVNVSLISKLGTLTDRVFVRRYYRRCGTCWVLPNVIKSMVGPAAWLIASFVDGTYYTCAVVGPSIEKRNITNVTAIKELEAQFAIAKSMSHIWAWIVFLVMVILTALVVAFQKCFLKETLLEDDYTLERREAISAMLTFRYFIDNQHEIKDFLRKEDGNVPPDSKFYDFLVTGGSIPEAEPDKYSIVFTVLGAPLVKIKDEENEASSVEKVKDKHEIIKGWYVKGDENIEIHVNGMPERNGREWVIKLFKKWSKKPDDWPYDKLYEAFAKQYPRATSGRPWREEWVSRKNETNETQEKPCWACCKRV